MTKQRRWPKNAEFARQKTYDLADGSINLLEEARQKIRTNPALAELAIADTQRFLSDIKRLMSEAKMGKQGES